MLNLEDMLYGLFFWVYQKPNWPRDLHNAEYYNIYQVMNTDNVEWWSKTVDRLSEWRAIRSSIPGINKKSIYEVGLTHLDAIKTLHLEIKEKDTLDGYIKTDWVDLSRIYAEAAQIKGALTATFPSKLCHFLCPNLFIVSDNQATGDKNYQSYWSEQHEAWEKFNDKQKAIDLINHYILTSNKQEIHSKYPFHIKIIELCSIGKNIKTTHREHQTSIDDILNHNLTKT